jgi:HTH-type transcriptional regulator/antitoxin HipB
VAKIPQADEAQLNNSLSGHLLSISMQFGLNVPDREFLSCLFVFKLIYSLSGTFTTMKYTAKSIGNAIRKARKSLNATQKDLALTSGTGLRFIIELEKGKPTCQLGKVLTVLNTLGIKIELTQPLSEVEEKMK